MNYISDLIKCLELQKTHITQSKKQFSAMIKTLESALKDSYLIKNEEDFIRISKKADSFHVHIERAEKLSKVLDNEIKDLKIKLLQ